jgi:NADH:ubiquinone oxidoreductase subunit K
MGGRLCAATGVILFLIGLAGFLWPRWGTRRLMAAALMMNGVALCSVGGSQGGSGEGRAMALLVLGLLPTAYLLAGSLWREKEQ